MPKILDAYSFNIPRGKTAKARQHGARGGHCPRPCAHCVAHTLCGGCDGLCPDAQCPGQACARCAGRCARSGALLEPALRTVDGLTVDLTPQADAPFAFDVQRVRYIPAITKPLRTLTQYPVVSIPFYALWDFQQETPLVTAIRHTFKLADHTQIIGNFYFKDDKIAYVFDRILDGTFFAMLGRFPEVTYWQTPCFSVFTYGNGMDTLLNFKRQFWIGDQMRAAGLNVIQEVLYSLKPHIAAGMADVIKIIRAKQIMKIATNCQLITDFVQSLSDERPFVRGLPRHVVWLQTGLSSQHAEAYRRLRWENMLFANYSGEFTHRKEWERYVSDVNTQLIT